MLQMPSFILKKDRSNLTIGERLQSRNLREDDDHRSVYQIKVDGGEAPLFRDTVCSWQTPYPNTVTFDSKGTAPHAGVDLERHLAEIAVIKKT